MITPILHFLYQHLSAPYFAFGVAGLSLATIVVGQHSSRNGLIGGLWLLGVFGFCQAFNEGLFELFREAGAPMPHQLDILGSVLCLVGALSLYILGSRLMLHSRLVLGRGWALRVQRWKLVPPLLLIAAAVCFSPSALPALRNTSRLFLLAPGALLIGLSLMLQSGKASEEGRNPFRFHLLSWLGGVCFILAAILSWYNRQPEFDGLPFFPSASLLEISMGLNPSFWRAVTLILGLLFIGLLLRERVLWLEDRERASRDDLSRQSLALASLNATLEERSAARSRELLLVNDELEREIARHQATERELIASAARLEALFNQSAIGISFVDTAGIYVRVNERFCQMLGRSEGDLVGRHYREVSQEDCLSAEAEHWRGLLEGRGDYFWMEKRYRRSNGTAFWASVHIIAVQDLTKGLSHLIGMHVDIDSRKRAEETQRRQEAQQQRTQRLESIGSLASGIAHDLNNALVPVLAGAGLLKSSLSEADRPLLESMESSAQRAAEMVRHLLTFARGAEGRKIPVSMDALLGEMRLFIERTFPNRIQFQLLSRCEGLQVLGDPTQLHQVLLNLCVNARDAMEGAGNLSLEISQVSVSQEELIDKPVPVPGIYAELRVTDTGSGIPPAIRDRIFDPFFTTKGPNKGTGLGLSTVMGIVKGHQGGLDLESTMGRGTTFTIWLPVCSASGGKAVAPAPATVCKGEGRLILVVDDEAFIHDTLRLVLAETGFRLLHCKNGLEALAWLGDASVSPDLLITDLNMPVMDGLALVRAVRKVRAALPVIAMSGDLTTEQARSLRRERHVLRLTKPFTRTQVLDAVETMTS